MRLPQIQEAKRLLVIESQVGTYFKVIDTESNGEFRVETFYNKHRENTRWFFYLLFYRRLYFIITVISLLMWHSLDSRLPTLLQSPGMCRLPVPITCRNLIFNDFLIAKYKLSKNNQSFCLKLHFHHINIKYQAHFENLPPFCVWNRIFVRTWLYSPLIYRIGRLVYFQTISFKILRILLAYLIISVQYWRNVVVWIGIITVDSYILKFSLHEMEIFGKIRKIRSHGLVTGSVPMGLRVEVSESHPSFGFSRCLRIRI